MIQTITNSQAEHKNWKKTTLTDHIFFYYTKWIVRVMRIVRLGYTRQQKVKYKKGNQASVLSYAVLQLPKYYLLVQYTFNLELGYPVKEIISCIK